MRTPIPNAQPVIGITATVRTLDLPFASVDAHTVFVNYVQQVAAAGGIPVVLPVVDPALADRLVAAVDALVLTGGGDVDPQFYGGLAAGNGSHDAARDRFELALARAARSAGTPTLGVCRGLQILNVARGGTLTDHIDGHRDLAIRHRLTVAAGSALASIAGRALDTGSLHHQAVAEVGAGLRVVATAPDGIVEALEADDGAAVLGVQWHPELEPGDAGAPLWRWLVGQAVAAR